MGLKFNVSTHVEQKQRIPVDFYVPGPLVEVDGVERIREVHLPPEPFGHNAQPDIHTGVVSDGSTSLSSLVLLLRRSDLPHEDSHHVTGLEHLHSRLVVVNLLRLVVEEHRYVLQLWLLLTESILDPPDRLVSIHLNRALRHFPFLNVLKDKL